MADEVTREIAQRPKDHPKWVVRLRWWLWEDSPEWFPSQAVLRALCWAFGHFPDRDQCNIPEHDYCVLCWKSMPGRAWSRARQSGSTEGASDGR